VEIKNVIEKVKRVMNLTLRMFKMVKERMLW
jgi:hypothetical protein